MKLSQWAKANSVNYQTAWKHFRAGLIPGAYQLPTGTVVVPEAQSTPQKDKTVVYARVSSSENKPNLISQAERVSQFCNAKGWVVESVVKETGSGLNDQRPKLLALLKDASITRIVVEHKDRLTRFGFSYIETMLLVRGCELVVINNAETSRDDLVQDFVSVITSFCSRIYGKRRSKRNTERLIEDMKNAE